MRARALLLVLLLFAVVALSWGDPFAIVLAAWSETPVAEVESARAYEPLSLIAFGLMLGVAATVIRRVARAR
ncbi:MAG: hypothetical protein R2752_22940 [Vicinamibacterales bacterium]